MALFLAGFFTYMAMWFSLDPGHRFEVIRWNGTVVKKEPELARVVGRLDVGICLVYLSIPLALAGAALGIISVGLEGRKSAGSLAVVLGLLALAFSQCFTIWTLLRVVGVHEPMLGR
jgi:hypothetical protein